MSAARLALALAIAFHVWGAAPCGHVSLAWADLGDDNLGGAIPCMIMFNTRRREALANWETVCTTTVHEWGHLTGHKHSVDPRNVMYPTAMHYWRCTTKRPHHGFTAGEWAKDPP